MKQFTLNLNSDQLALIGNLVAQRLGYLISVGADEDRLQELHDIIKAIGIARGVYKHEAETAGLYEDSPRQPKPR